MRRSIKNTLLGNVSIDEKVTSLRASGNDEDEEADETEGEETESEDEVSESSDSNVMGTPSMSEAAGADGVSDSSDTGITSTSDDDSDSTLQGGSSVGIDPQKVAELENRPTSLENKSAANFLFPTTNPIGRGQMEIGYAKISGTGTVEIPYEYDFTNQPALVQTNFGYFNFDVPTGFSWSYDLDIDFSSLWYDFDFSFDIDWTTIRLPSFAFLWNVEGDKFVMFNAWGETWITYCATER